LPSEPEGSVRAVLEKPWASTRVACTLCSMLAHTSPMSERVEVEKGEGRMLDSHRELRRPPGAMRRCMG
jgi:hypothetical protein